MNKDYGFWIYLAVVLLIIYFLIGFEAVLGIVLFYAAYTGYIYYRTTID